MGGARFLGRFPVDHTWVTTYDARTSTFGDAGDVEAAGENFWYCYGYFRPIGGTPANPTGYLGSDAGNRAFAECLVEPNRDSWSHDPAKGTILAYGVDGVCHQVANQVLYASNGCITVCQARGYMLTEFRYGTYGRHPSWGAKVTSCSTGNKFASPPPFDAFESRAREILSAPEDRDALAKLLDIRRQFLASMDAMRSDLIARQPSSEVLNSINQHFFNAAADILGPIRYHTLFGVEARAKVDLVDPEVLARSGRHRQERVR
ncbi:MAG TPA: hypothetical protein VKV24_20135 [Casimicrobiaceae bacterium]|nr:hypothetical protein [Casimicrobiaceae bacterium]